MRLKAKLIFSASAVAVLGSLFVPHVALAQEADAASAPEENSIIVTGSRIQTRSAAAAGSNVDVLGSEDIAQSAPTGNIVDVLRVIPQNFGNQGQFDRPGRDVAILEGDLRDPAAPMRLVEAAIGKFNGLDAPFSNAGAVNQSLWNPCRCISGTTCLR